jgi:hypothetical protein
MWLLQCVCDPDLIVSHRQAQPAVTAAYHPCKNVMSMLHGSVRCVAIAPSANMPAACWNPCCTESLSNRRALNPPQVFDWPSLRSVHPLSHVSHNSCVPLPTTRASRHVAQPLMRELQQHTMTADVCHLRVSVRMYINVTAIPWNPATGDALVGFCAFL